MAIENGEKEKTLKFPVRDEEKYGKYVSALSKASDLFQNGKGILTYDSPQKELSYHTLTIQLIKDEFDDNEVKLISEIVGAFDSLFIYSASDCTVYIQLIIHDVYEEGA